MKNIFITGVAGFLGSHLAKYHLSRGHAVAGVDNFSSSTKHSLHISELMTKKRYDDDSFTFFEADIAVHTSLFGAASRFEKRFGNIDIIYNLACPASPPRYQAIPIETLLTCTTGVSNVLNLALDNGAIVVHASTSEVYGDPDRSPQNEEYRGCVNPYGPRSCYDEGKRAAEALCYDYYNKCKVDARLVRIFNTYGPHLDVRDGRVISNFVYQALNNQNLTVYGDGSQTRSFCYVDDLIKAIVAMGQLTSNPGTPINIGNPNEFTIKQLADLVLEILPHSNSKIEWYPIPIDDPMQRRPDISKAKEILGWEPTVNLKDGLMKTIEYMKKNQ